MKTIKIMLSATFLYVVVVVVATIYHCRMIDAETARYILEDSAPKFMELPAPLQGRVQQRAFLRMLVGLPNEDGNDDEVEVATPRISPAQATAEAFVSDVVNDRISDDDLRKELDRRIAELCVSSNGPECAERAHIVAFVDATARAAIGSPTAGRLFQALGKNALALSAFDQVVEGSGPVYAHKLLTEMMDDATPETIGAEGGLMRTMFEYGGESYFWQYGLRGCIEKMSLVEAMSVRNALQRYLAKNRQCVSLGGTCVPDDVSDGLYKLAAGESLY